MTQALQSRKIRLAFCGLFVLSFSFLLAGPLFAQQVQGKVFQSTSLVRKTAAGNRQLLMADVTATDTMDAVIATILLPGETKAFTFPVGRLPKGTSRHFFEVPVVREADSAVLHIAFDNRTILSMKGPIVPPRTWKIYDVQVSHHDMGYADYYQFMRRDVREMGIEMALDFCRRTDAWASTDRFHWTVETSEPMTKFISSHSPAVLRELTQRIKEGRIALGALHNSVSTEMMGYEAMARLFYTPNRYIRDLLGIPPSRTALITDVVGLARTLPTFLKEADIPYFYHGYNDTVDGMYPASAEPVFFWKGLDGDSVRMPLFRSFPYYSPDRLTKYTAEEISTLLDTYERGRRWPYDCMIAEDSYDFSVPQFDNVEGIRRWNEQYANPVLVCGTFDMFFDDVMKQADPSRIAVYDQDAPNAWADEDGSDGKLSGDARLLNYELPTVEKLSTLALASGGKGYPWKEIWQAYHTLIAYHEHTNGAFSEEDVLPIPFQKTPKAANANYYECEQVMHKALVREAEECTRSARTQAFGQLKQLISSSHDSTLVVFNPLAVPRSGFAAMPLADGNQWTIIDNTSGKEVLSQEMPDGQVLFAADNIPSMGYKTFRLIRKAVVEQPARPAEAGVMENDFYQITIDDSTGAVSSIRDKKRNLELVDRSSEFKFNQYLYQRIDSAFSRTPTSYRPRMISKDFVSGPLASVAMTTVAAEGCRSIRQSVILYRNSDRIDFIVELDKAESGRTLKSVTAKNKEALFYVLPLNIPDFTIHHELPGGVVEPLAHQFKGSTTNYFGIQHMSDLSNAHYGVTLATVNAPLVEYGAPRPALWLAPSDAEFGAKRGGRSHIALYLMNNMFFTNIPYSQPGQATFRWSIRAHDGDWVAGKAYAFGWDASHPFETFLIEKKHQAALPASRYSFLTIDNGHVYCSTFKPAEANGDGFILRFFELTGKASKVRVQLPVFGNIARAVETNLVEDDREVALPVTNRNEISFSIAPFGVKTIRVVPVPPATPRAPRNVKALAKSDREVSLSWRGMAATDPAASYFRVYRGTAEDFTPSLATCVGTTTRMVFDDRPTLNVSGWLDNRPEPATTYYYRIETVGPHNTRSDLTQPIRITTLFSSEKNSPPNKVLGVAATPVSPISSFHYVCLLFSTNVESDVTRYRIYRSEAPGFPADNAHLLIDLDARTKYTHVIPHAFATVTRELREYAKIIYPDESAKPNRRYYYRVCAVDEAGQAGELSDEVSAISPINSLSFAGDLFFFDSTRVDIRPVLGDGSEIRYTTDGTNPDTMSALYTEPFTITKPVTVKAAMFYPGKAAPFVTGEARYMRALYPPPKYLQPYSEKWPGQGPLNMVDGIHGAAHFDNYFQGFEGNDMDVILDLGGKKPLHELQVTMLQNIGVWIFLPERVEFFVSHDGANFEKVADVQTEKELERKEGTFMKKYTVSLGERAANFVRVHARNIGMCPPWHAGFEYKGKAWIFADEVEIH